MTGIVSGVRKRTALQSFTILCALALIIMPARGASQTISTGVLTGIVRDGARLPLNGVIVTIINRENGQRYSARTDRAGRYASDLLEPGHYDALFERLGYTPLRAEEIVVEPAIRREFSVTLVERTGDNPTQTIATSTGLSSAPGQSGPDRWLIDGRNTASMPFEGSGIEALKRISSVAGYRGDVSGLPGHMVGVILDGVPLSQRFDPFSTLVRNSAIPLAYLSQVTLRSNAFDTEYPSLAAGQLSGFFRRGGRNRGIVGFGDFTSDPLASGSGTVESFTSYRAGALVQGAIIRDTAAFIVGGEVQRAMLPFDPLWVESATTTQLANAARNQYGVDLAGYTSADLATFDRESAFGRVDFRISSGSNVTIRGIFARLKKPAPVAPWTGSALGSTITPDFQEIIASATLISRIDENLLSEIDLGFESSRTEQQAAAARAGALPATHVVSASRDFGSTLLPEGNSSLTAFYLRGTLHFRSGNHFRKIGLVANVPTYDVPYNAGRVGEYTFGNVTDFRDGFGLYRRVVGMPSRADIELRSVGLIAQDVWQPRPGLQLLAGARLTSFRMPDSSKITLDRGWAQLTGLLNRATPGRLIEFEPRISIEINPSGRTDWRLNGGISIDSHQADPSVVAEILSNAGLLDVRAGFGNIGLWPSSAAEPPTSVRGATLTVIGPKFRGPRTTRAVTGIEHTFGSQAVIDAQFAYRKTEFLPQRVNLNGTGTVTGRDQHGRPLFGTLAKHGELLYAVEGSNRRFGAYADVWGLQSAGTSKSTALTVTGERPLLGPVGLFASYTWSKTEDDWLYGDPSDPFTQIAPFPDSLVNSPWQYGISDFDVPHRAVVGAEIVIPAPLTPRLSGLFKYQSGYPFTPGYRPGVDANADGSGRNDPAFIDGAIAGVSELLSAWPCLQTSSGDFAARNSCRGPAIQSMDARLTLSWRNTGGIAADVVLDALNLFATDAGIIDAAVYAVDPSNPLALNGTVVTVPLTANPNFGQLLTRFTPQRQIRLGLRVRF